MLTNFPVNVKAPPAAAILEHTGLVHGYFRYAVGTRSPASFCVCGGRCALAAQMCWFTWGRREAWSPRSGMRRFFRLCGIRRMIGVPLTEDMQRNRWQEAEQALEPEARALRGNLRSWATPIWMIPRAGTCT